MKAPGTKILTATIFYSFGEIIPRILAFLLLPVLTQFLSPAEFGINSYIAAVMSFLFVIATLSLNTYILRNYFLVNDDLERQKLIGGVFLFICVFNLLLILIEIILIPIGLDLFNIDIPFYPYFFLAILNNFFDVISIIPLAIFRAKRDAKRFFYLSVSRIILQYILIYILIAVAHMGLLGTFYARLFINIPFAILYFIIATRHGILEFNLSRMKDALRFSLPLLPGGLSYLIITLSDRIILERFVSLSEIGIYSVAFTLALALNVVVQALYKTLEPILFKEYASSYFEDLNTRIFRYYLLLVFAGGFALSLLSKEVFLLATSGKYHSGYTIVPFMVVSVIIAGANVYLSTLLVAKRKQKILSIATIFSAVLSISVNFLLIPYLGYKGAAISSILASCTSNIIEHAFVKLKHKLIYQQILLLVIVCATPYLFDYLLPDLNMGLSIGLKLVLLLTFSALAFFILGCNYRKDMQFVRSRTTNLI